MIFQRSVRQQAGLLSAFPKCFVRQQVQARGKHTVPKLIHNETFKESGVPELLTPQGFHIAWTQYQRFLVDKLNKLTSGTTDETSTSAALLLKYARDASMASLFNHASMAFNNHYFFNAISPKPVPMPGALEQAIVDSCSSVDSLKAEFLATANAMFGPGFVWLVKTKDTGQLKIIATYIAGSPLAAAHYRRQPADMATETTGVRGGESFDAATKVANKSYGSMGSLSNAKFLAPGGIDTHPILCVNTWEHVWLADWGVGNKAAFLEAWWNKINWEEVNQRFNQVRPESTLKAEKGNIRPYKARQQRR